MRINHTKRIYMNEADASPGNGAAATSPATPASVAAPTAPETPAPLTIDTVKTHVADQLKAFQNEFFANARKAGLLKKDDPAPPAQAPAAASASTGLTAAEVQRIIEHDRALTRVEIEHKLTPAQSKRMRAMAEAEKPEDVSGWASSFVTDMGFARPTESTTVTPVPQPQPNGQPISDKGSPAPGGVVNWEREFAENPIGMSAAARAAMDAKHGRDKAIKMRLEASVAQAARIKVTTSPQG